MPISSFDLTFELISNPRTTIAKSFFILLISPVFKYLLYFEIELNETKEDVAKNLIEEMCKKLLANLIIENYKINKIS